MGIWDPTERLGFQEPPGALWRSAHASCFVGLLSLNCSLNPSQNNPQITPLSIYVSIHLCTHLYIHLDICTHICLCKCTCIHIYQHPQLPFKTPQIPSNRDHKALNRGTLGGLGIYIYIHMYVCRPQRPRTSQNCHCGGSPILKQSRS